MKKIVSVLLVVALALTAVNANGQKEATGKSWKVQLITMDQMDQHWANVDKGAQKAVTELGNIDYKWNAPATKDDAQQIECINNAVAQGADAILLAANGPDAVTAALKEATAAGVKIIYVDSAANYQGEAIFATDNKAAGKTAGEQMLKKFQEMGIKDGKIGVISVNTATASTVAREKGFREAFQGKGYDILESQYCDGDAARSKDAAANFITQGVVGLFGANEGSTVGIGNAIHESGSKVVGVGFDKSDMIKQLIKDGYLLCTMAQNPDVMGYDGIKAAAEVLSGKNLGGEVVDTGVSVLTKDNI
ncbi:MAG: substrate-binding domain-containing protein [Sphaerochaetaceae bacterium]|jgi:ribose transport system substrate-binding protein